MKRLGLPKPASKPGVGDGIARIALDGLLEHFHAQPTIFCRIAVMMIFASQEKIVSIQSLRRCLARMRQARRDIEQAIVDDPGSISRLLESWLTEPKA